ncbi:MAG: phosphatase PAP2 family protein [Candidatus Shapirobacteria bacterium]
MFSLKGIFFWQPRRDFLKLLLSFNFGSKLLLILNYLIWPFLFLVCFLIIKSSANYFWQILTAVVIGEIIERFCKNKFFWKRPLYLKKDQTPTGLVKRWYETGSFPSGHTTKATYFFLLILQTQVFNPVLYLVLTVPLLLFRVLAGFHYPIDVLGGIIIGTLLWLATHQLIFPLLLVEIIRTIFNFVFFIK